MKSTSGWGKVGKENPTTWWSKLFFRGTKKDTFIKKQEPLMGLDAQGPLNLSDTKESRLDTSDERVDEGSVSGHLVRPSFLKQEELPKWVEVALRQFTTQHWRFNEETLRQWSWRQTREKSGVAEITILMSMLAYFVVVPMITIVSFSMMKWFGAMGGLVAMPLVFWWGYVLMSTLENINARAGSLWEHLNWSGRWELLKRSFSLSSSKAAALWGSRPLHDINAEFEAMKEFSTLLDQHEPELLRTGQDWWVTEKKMMELMEVGVEIPKMWQDAFQELKYWPKGFIQWVDKKWAEEIFEKEWASGQGRSALIQERIQGSLGLSGEEGQVWIDPWQAEYEKELEEPKIKRTEECIVRKS